MPQQHTHLPKATSMISWLKAESAARILGMHRNTVTRRAIPWGAEHRRGRIRFKNLRLDKEAGPTPRYFWPDIKALLANPGPLGLVEYTPIFINPPQTENRFHVPNDESPKETPVIMRIERAAEFLDVSRDTIEKRLVDWQDSYVSFRIRCAKIQLQEGGRGIRSCFRADVEALLQEPASPDDRLLENRFHVEKRRS